MALRAILAAHGFGKRKIPVLIQQNTTLFK